MTGKDISPTPTSFSPPPLSEILVIEYSANGLLAAQAAGMRTLMIPNQITRCQGLDA